MHLLVPEIELLSYIDKAGGEGINKTTLAKDCNQSILPSWDFLL